MSDDYLWWRRMCMAAIVAVIALAVVITVTMEATGFR